MDYFDFGQLTLIIAIIAGVIAGCIAVACIKPAIIVGSAAIGANLLTNLTIVIAQSSLNINLSAYALIILIAIAILGSLFQFRNARNIE